MEKYQSKNLVKKSSVMSWAENAWSWKKIPENLREKVVPSTYVKPMP